MIESDKISMIRKIRAKRKEAECDCFVSINFSAELSEHAKEKGNSKGYHPCRDGWLVRDVQTHVIVVSFFCANILSGVGLVHWYQMFGTRQY